MKKTFAIVLSYFLWAIGAFAQGGAPWTLQRCIDYALENNLEIRRKMLSRETKKIDVNDYRWAFTPSISLGSSVSIASGRVLDHTTYEFLHNSMVENTSSSLSGSMSLFSGLRKVYALRRAKLSLLEEAASLESLKYDIRKNVTAAFLSLLCAESDLESARQTRRLIEVQLERIQLLLDAGKVTESDILLARSQHFAAESDCATAEGTVQSARLDLCQLLEISDYENFEIIGEDTVPQYLETLPASFQESVVWRPEYRKAALSVDIARQEVNIARSALFPTLSLSAGYGSSFSSARMKAVQNEDGTFRYEAYPFLSQYLDNRNSNISLSLSIPIFTGMSTRNGIRRKRLALQDAEYAMASIEKALIKEYLQAGIDCRSAYKRYLTAERQFEYANEAERQIRERYFFGSADFNMWNTAVTELAKARYALSAAKYTFIFKLKVLEMF